MKTKKDPVVAIDGPAGCGKSLISGKLATDFHFVKIDTGALFRAVALFLSEHFNDLETSLKSVDAFQLQKLLSNLQFHYKTNPVTVSLNGKEYGPEHLREHRVSELASIVSANPEVRKIIEKWQRNIVESGKDIYVVEGRDIGTVVFPNAQAKIFLTASPEVRAQRRFVQLQQNGKLGELTEKKILEDIKKRDTRDSSREIAPLMKADDAFELDTSDLSIEEVLDTIKQILTKQGLINA
ncbi:MAG: (d)CMP kinase [Halobacteriovoraceae bacterium]|nr:(d)CMP kinase [Halobacteriovoraceae bacterium]MCB9093890.1 (d)CMP kinase [Halobacteriovoraceae bacterium]